METGGLGLGGVIVYGRGAGGLRLWGVSVGAPSAGSRGVPGARAGRVLWHLCVWVWPKGEGRIKYFYDSSLSNSKIDNV